MNPIENQLLRLFKSASRAPRVETGAAGFALETRVIGQWRAAPPGDGAELLVAWFRRAAICACGLALLSLVWNHHEQAAGTGDEFAVADSAMRTGVMP